MEENIKNLKKTRIKKGKIILRPVFKKDLEQIMCWLKDPEVNKFLSSDFSDLDLKKEKNWFLTMKTSINDFIFAIEDFQNKKYIGDIGFHRINWDEKTCEFGICIGDKNYWDKGYGTDVVWAAIDFAFKKLNLLKIKLFVYEYNVRAIRAYEKCGFKKKEILIKDHLYENTYWDTIVMVKYSQDFT